MKIATGQTVLAAAFALLTLGSPEGHAQDLVTVPGEYEFAEGRSGNCIPLGLGCLGSGASSRHQQIYLADEFGGQSGLIDKIAFRLNCGQQPFDVTGISIEVRLSHTPTAPNLMSYTFADNIGTDETPVLNNSNLSLSSAGGQSGCPAPFDVVLDVEDVFFYDGMQNLLVDMTIYANPLNAFFDAVVKFGAVGRAFAVGSGGAGATMATSVTPIALVTQFHFAAPGGGETDGDGDGVLDVADNCPVDPNPEQRDNDGDGDGDLCDWDDDGDGVADAEDNCPTLANADQADSDNDGYGDACMPPGSLAKGVSLGAGWIMGENVSIHKGVTAGDGLTVGNNVTIDMYVTIGNDVTIFPRSEIR